MAPLAAEIGRRYESEYPQVRVDVQTGGSSRGVNDVRRHLADIVMVSRALKADEHDLRAYTIALDGIGIIVHAENPVTSVNQQQIIDIYTGRITNWRAMGGAERPITVVNKAEGRSTLELFLRHFALKNTDIQAHVVIGDNQQGIKTVAGNPSAIGYVSIGAAEYEASQGMPIRLLPMAGVAATGANVRNGAFPLSRPLNLVTRGAPDQLTEAFIDFARSTGVNDLIAAQYFIPPQR